MAVSNIGTWVQMTALNVVVYRITGKGTSLGFNVACQFIPMLLIGAWAGALSDRQNRLKVTRITQAAMTAHAFTVAGLAAAGWLKLPVIYAASLTLGILGAFDNPARRGLVIEMVDPSEMSNAMALNTAVMTGSRMFGPAIAAFMIRRYDPAWCFLVNGVSFLFLLAALFRFDTSRLHPSPPAKRGGTPVRDGLRFVMGDPRTRAMFISLTIVSTFAFNYSVSFQLLADRAFHDSRSFGLLLGVSAAGSFTGSLITASRREIGVSWFLGSITLLGVSGMTMMAAPNLWSGLVLSIPVGISGASFIASSNVILQQYCPPDMRGRLLSLTAVAFLGSTPIGGPITGWIGDHVGARWSLGYGSLAAIGAATWAWWRIRRNNQAQSRYAGHATEPVASRP